MDLNDIKKAVSEVAPEAEALLSTLGLPGMAGAAGLKMLTSVFGIDEKSTPDQVIDAIKADPQAVLKLQLADKDAQVKKRDQDIQQLQMEISDTQDARKRDSIFIAQGKPNWRADLMLIFSYGILIGIGVAYFTKALPPETQNFFMLTAGYMLREITTAFSFEFGASRGNDQAIQLLAQSDPIKQQGA